MRLSKRQPVRSKSVSSARFLLRPPSTNWLPTITLPFKTGFVAFPTLCRKTMHAEKNYTSRLGAGLGMIHETMDLLRVWQPGITPLRLSKHALDAGLFSRTTARRNEDLA